MAKKSEPALYVSAKQGLHFRAAPGGESVKVLPYGTEVKPIGFEGAWANVKVGNKKGWVMTRYLGKEPV